MIAIAFGGSGAIAATMICERPGPAWSSGMHENFSATSGDSRAWTVGSLFSK